MWMTTLIVVILVAISDEDARNVQSRTVYMQEQYLFRDTVISTTMILIILRAEYNQEKTAGGYGVGLIWLKLRGGMVLAGRDQRR